MGMERRVRDALGVGAAGTRPLLLHHRSGGGCSSYYSAKMICPFSPRWVTEGVDSIQPLLSVSTRHPPAAPVHPVLSNLSLPLNTSLKGAVNGKHIWAARFSLAGIAIVLRCYTRARGAGTLTFLLYDNMSSSLYVYPTLVDMDHGRPHPGARRPDHHRYTANHREQA
eukprot:6203188-Pleurochrysis_carterae.AAC.3